ncbi:MAG TPA: YebC/PmpR family DNA-binding transcriptional regulator [bacterium]|nr:YebC/PmpR family DNA-binding transcriptional regulator [bacterium]HPT29441.1 YebC/PmpR family DNA-binding transcriptional regulator [bacterium]
MSGHSKWATTHRQKAVVDAKRGAVFTKMANIITIAARGGGDPDANPSLRAAVDRARSVSMPKDNIERAIKKGTGELGGEQVSELYYEGVGQGGLQLVIKCITDNKNRSASTVRHTLSKYGAALGNVLWNFEQKGVIMIDRSEIDAQKINTEELELELIDSGLDDMKVEEEGLTLYCRVESLQELKNNLEQRGLKIESANIEYVAKEKINLDEASLNTIDKLLEELDDNEDVSDYYSNLA